MKQFVTLAAGAALAFNLTGTPSNAMDDKEKAALGAIALLGIAALAHNQNHYHEGQEPQGADQTAQFERGCSGFSTMDRGRPDPSSSTMP